MQVHPTVGLDFGHKRRCKSNNKRRETCAQPLDYASGTRIVASRAFSGKSLRRCRDLGKPKPRSIVETFLDHHRPPRPTDGPRIGSEAPTPRPPPMPASGSFPSTPQFVNSLLQSSATTPKTGSRALYAGAIQSCTSEPRRSGTVSHNNAYFRMYEGNLELSFQRASLAHEVGIGFLVAILEQRSQGLEDGCVVVVQPFAFRSRQQARVDQLLDRRVFPTRMCFSDENELT